jgi:hypothetical protein
MVDFLIMGMQADACHQGHKARSNRCEAKNAVILTVPIAGVNSENRHAATPCLPWGPRQMYNDLLDFKMALKRV